MLGAMMLGLRFAQLTLFETRPSNAERKASSAGGLLMKGQLPR